MYRKRVAYIYREQSYNITAIVLVVLLQLEPADQKFALQRACRSNYAIYGKPRANL